MSAANASVTSYRVRAHLDAHVQVFINVPLALDATYYFKQPDKFEVQFDAVPELAKQFKDFYASAGTPATWPKEYVITLLAPSSQDPPTTATLKLVSRQRGSLDYALISVDTTTNGVIAQRWLYRDGSSINVVQQNDVTSTHVLPSHQEADFSFPHYRAHCVVDYGAYEINVPIADSIFKK